MAKKAYISEIQEQKYVSKDNKKKVFPVTIEDAVKVKKQDGIYTNLKEALYSKWGDALTMKFLDDEGIPTYYMFTFSIGKNMGPNDENKALLRQMLVCSNSEFVDLCAQHDETVNINLTNIPLTVASVEDRVNKSEYLKTLFLNKIVLHNQNIPTLAVVDENGTEYGSGDTIYFTSYPGKLWLSAKNLDSNYIQDLDKMIAYTNDKHFLQASSDTPDYNFTELEFCSDTNPTSDMYVNPLRLPSFWREMGIGDIEYFIQTLVKGNVYFQIMPSDYPHGDDIAVHQYKTQERRGKMYINDYVRKYNQTTHVEELSYMSSGFMPCWFNIVFLPTEEEPEFHLDTPNPVNLTKNSNWTGDLYLKGSFAQEGKTLTLETSGTCPFLFKKSTTSAYVLPSEIVITKEEITNGITLNVRPADYRNEDYYIPSIVAEEPSIYTESIGIVYDNDTDNKTLVRINCTSVQSDFPEVTPSPIIDQMEVVDTKNYNYYYLIRVKDDWNITRVHSWSVTGKLASNGYKLYYRLIDDYVEGETTLADLIAEQHTSNIQITTGYSIDTSAVKYILFSAVITPADVSTPYFRVFLEIGNSNGSEIIQIEFTKNESSISPSSPNTFDGDPGRAIVFNVATPETVGIANRLDPNGRTFKDAITVQDLVNINSLQNGVFSGLTTLEDGSFVQYMTRLQEIPDYAFYGCTNMTTIVLPEGITRIGRQAFEGCESLTEIVIPDSVTEIDDYAFRGCTNLTKIVFGSGLPVIQYRIGLTDSDNLHTIVLKYSGTQIVDDVEEVPAGVILDTLIGTTNPNKIGFSLAIQGENSSNVTFYAPDNLISWYTDPQSLWEAFLPDATWSDIDTLTD